MKQHLSNLRVNKKSNGYSFPRADVPLINAEVKRSTDNIFARPTYSPPTMATPRRGADDHHQFKTKGYPT
jgi:hypothetical protein